MRAPRAPTRHRLWRPPPENGLTPRSAPGTARPQSAHRAPARQIPASSWSGRRTIAGPASRSAARPRSAQRSRRICGPGIRRAPPAIGAARAIVAATSRRSVRSRPDTGRSGRRPGSSGVRATYLAGGRRRRPARAPRTPGRAPSPPRRTGRSRCNRLRRNVIDCSTRPVRPMRLGRRRWPTRYRPAVAPVSRWWGPTVTANPRGHRAPDRSRATMTAARLCRSR